MDQLTIGDKGWLKADLLSAVAIFHDSAQATRISCGSTICLNHGDGSRVEGRQRIEPMHTYIQYTIVVTPSASY